jgi:lipoprotein-anchoring transpeptidase ErfK/SrfK
LKLPLALAPSILLIACQQEASDAHEKAATATPTPMAADPLKFERVPDASSAPAASPVLAAQVALDRLGFSPQVIDGKEGPAFTLALQGFQEANDLPASGTLDDRTGQALARQWNGPASVVVTIPEGFARGPFNAHLPDSMEGKAKLDRIGYRTMTEALAERFHTTPETLIALNGKGTRLAAGRTIRVPNIADPTSADHGDDTRGWNRTLRLLGVSSSQPQAEKIVVDKSEGALQAFDKQGKVLARFPVTTGSSHDPLPIGTWTVKGIAHNPDYHYNPDLFWDADDSDGSVMLPPGPNGPVGVVWIDLSKPHYGIHGTPEPQLIGRTESHGCVRLTNWDAARLAQMVSPGTKVVFQL